MKNYYVRKQAVASIIGLIGVVLAGYMIKLLGDNGIYADATGKAPSPNYSALEWIAVFLGVIMVIISIVWLIRNEGKRKR
jgi:cytochrome bd-type quinol oxidase subunit 2